MHVVAGSGKAGAEGLGRLLCCTDALPEPLGVNAMCGCVHVHGCMLVFCTDALPEPKWHQHKQWCAGEGAGRRRWRVRVRSRGCAHICKHTRTFVNVPCLHRRVSSRPFNYSLLSTRVQNLCILGGGDIQGGGCMS